MKRLIFLLGFSLIAQASSAQWELFPFNTTLYLQSPGYPGPRITGWHCDSIRTDTGGLQWHHFGYRGTPLSEIPCFDSLVAADSYLPSTSEQPYVGSNGSTWYLKFYSSNWPLHTNSHVGDSWMWTINTIGADFDYVEVEHIWSVVDTVLGQIDSIKVYSLQALSSGLNPVTHPINSQTITISKNHGFVELAVPGGYHLEDVASFELIGLRDSTQHLGFKMPAFEDYFHYHVGDKYYWDGLEFSNDPMGLHIRWHLMDEITDVQENDSTYKLYFNRSVEKEVWGYQYTGEPVIYMGPDADSIVIVKSSFQYLLDGLPGYGIGFGNHEWQNFWASFGDNNLTLHYLNELNVAGDFADTTLSMYSHYGYLDTTLCYATDVVGPSASLKLSTKLGITLRNGSYGVTEELSGAIIAGDTIGIAEPVGLHRVLLQSDDGVQLWPNPASELLHIDAGVAHLSYEIYNLQGAKLLAGRLQQSNTISLQQLPPGLYLLRLSKGKTSRFIHH